MEAIGLGEFNAFARICGEIDSCRADEILERALKGALALVPCASGAAALADGRGVLKAAVAVKSDGSVARAVAVPKDGALSLAAARREAIVVDSVARDARFAPREPGARAPRNLMAVPMLFAGRVVGALELIGKNSGDFGECERALVLALCSRAASAVFRAQSAAQAMMMARRGAPHGRMAAESALSIGLLKAINEVAQLEIFALITGEGGAGKGFVAREIHRKSGRARFPFVRVNCAAAKDGEDFWSVAGSGTLFLDEASLLPPRCQEALLSALKSGAVAARVVSSSRVDLQRMAQDGVFNGELLFRLAGIPLNVAPLRERREDIPALAMMFLARFADETKKRFTGFSSGALEALSRRSWPGNVRELCNAVERACVFGSPPVLTADDFRLGGSDGAPPSMTLKEAVNGFKRDYVMRVLEGTSGNKTKAAAILDVQRTYLSRLLEDLSGENK